MVICRQGLVSGTNPGPTRWQLTAMMSCGGKSQSAYKTRYICIQVLAT